MRHRLNCASLASLADDEKNAAAAAPLDASKSPPGGPAFKTLEFARGLGIVRQSFVLHGKCGEGAFSAVFRASPVDGASAAPKSLAVKVISQCCDLQRTCTEILLLNALKGSPNVISLVAACREADTVLLVMEYVEHRPFADFFRALSAKQVRHYMHCLLDALSRVHALGVVHRDVKPNNALYNPVTGRFALADFGLAHPVGGDGGGGGTAVASAKRHRGGGGGGGSTVVFARHPQAAAAAAAAPCRCTTRVVCAPCQDRRPLCAPRGGTNGYRPPEVLLQADRHDCRVDTWAAGCILAAFLSGVQPFLHCRSDADCLYALCCLFGLRPMRAAAAAMSRDLRVLDAQMPCASDPLPDDFPCRRDRLADVCRRLRRRAGRSSMAGRDPAAAADADAAFDLLDGLLQADPAKRLTAQEALRQPYFSQA